MTPLGKVQDKVYKCRIRIKEFFTDFDKLRSGFISQAQFKAGLDMAGFRLNATELEHLAQHYCNLEDPQLRVCYRTFVEDVDSVFGKKNLEKTPKEEVHREPTGLVDYERFTGMPQKFIGDEKETKLYHILENIAYNCRTKRITVKPFFDDASRAMKKMVNHVTPIQFTQALKCHVAPYLSPVEVEILTEKFSKDDIVNYVAFATFVDPPPLED